MKRKLSLGLSFLALFVSAISFVNWRQAVRGDEKSKLLRHVVLFNFKDELSKDEVKEVVDAFRGLPSKIDKIKDFEWGTDVSVENKAAGFTHCFVVTFATTEGRTVYLPHPAHKEFVSLVGPRLEDVLVVDFWVKN